MSKFKEHANNSALIFVPVTRNYCFYKHNKYKRTTEHKTFCMRKVCFVHLLHVGSTGHRTPFTQSSMPGAELSASTTGNALSFAKKNQQFLLKTVLLTN